jgi:hypothetical protein
LDILLGIADQSADPVGRRAACPSPVVQASTNEGGRYLALVGHDHGGLMKEETDRFRADDNKLREPSADIGCARRLNGFNWHLVEVYFLARSWAVVHIHQYSGDGRPERNGGSDAASLARPCMRRQKQKLNGSTRLSCANVPAGWRHQPSKARSANLLRQFDRFNRPGPCSALKALLPLSPVLNLMITYS